MSVASHDLFNMKLRTCIDTGEEGTPRISTFLRIALKNCETIENLCEKIPENKV